MHVHLAHLDSSNLVKLLRMANRPFGEKMAIAEVGKCSFVKQNVAIRKPIVTRNVPEFCGHTISSDIMYPVEVGTQ